MEPTLETYLDQLRQKKKNIDEDHEVSASVIDWLYKDLIMFCQGHMNHFRETLVISIFIRFHAN